MHNVESEFLSIEWIYRAIKGRSGTATESGLKFVDTCL